MVAVYGCGVVEEAEGDVAGPTGYVEPCLRGLGGGRAGIQGAHEVVFPETVDAEGHEVVHGVVRGGDGGEDGGDWRASGSVVVFV